MSTENVEPAPKCRKCRLSDCYWYGPLGGYSVQCDDCNKAQAKKRREARKKRLASK